MGDDRTALDMDLEGLDDFEPKKPIKPAPAVKKAVDKVSTFPSREATTEGQLNIKAPDGRVLERFKAMCKDDRRKYYDMLEVLMDSYEDKGQGG